MATNVMAKPSPRRPTGPLGWLTEPTLAGMARRKTLLAYLFLLPTMLGIIVFTAGPVLASFGLSLYQWNVISPPTFIGLTNYRQLFVDNTIFVAFLNTFKIAVLAVIVQVSLGLLIAYWVYLKLARWFRYYLRGAFMLPLLTSAASISIVMAYLFNQDFGVVNYYLGLLGIPHIPWLNSPFWAVIAIVLVYAWQQLGFTFILFTGALTNVSPELLDAADVDGAAGWQRFRHIIIPMISPTIFFAAIVGFIGTLQIFDQAYVMTQGGPGDATLTAVMQIYRSAFTNLQIGYGSTVAVILFIVILLVTGFQFAFGERFVFYQ